MKQVGMERFRLINYNARYTAVGGLQQVILLLTVAGSFGRRTKAISAYQLTGARFNDKTYEREGRRRSGAKQRGIAENEGGTVHSICSWFCMISRCFFSGLVYSY